MSRFSAFQRRAGVSLSDVYSSGHSSSSSKQAIELALLGEQAIAINFFHQGCRPLVSLRDCVDPSSYTQDYQTRHANKNKSLTLCTLWDLAGTANWTGLDLGDRHLSLKLVDTAVTRMGGIGASGTQILHTTASALSMIRPRSNSLNGSFSSYRVFLFKWLSKGERWMTEVVAF